MKYENTELVRLYVDQKKSCHEIALLDGRSESTIYKILVLNKVALRNKSEANKIFADLVLITLYNLGLSFKQMSRLLGIHPTTISKRFDILHFPVRSSQVAKSIGYSNAEFQKYYCNNRFIDLLKEIV
jgi:DNA-binding CsgD family transcriptional regulator